MLSHTIQRYIAISVSHFVGTLGFPFVPDNMEKCMYTISTMNNDVVHSRQLGAASVRNSHTYFCFNNAGIIFYFCDLDHLSVLQSVQRC